MSRGVVTDKRKPKPGRREMPADFAERAIRMTRSEMVDEWNISHSTCDTWLARLTREQKLARKTALWIYSSGSSPAGWQKPAPPDFRPSADEASPEAAQRVLDMIAAAERERAAARQVPVAARGFEAQLESARRHGIRDRLVLPDPVREGVGGRSSLDNV